MLVLGFVISLGLASAQLYEPDSPTITSLYAHNIDVCFMEC